MFDFLNHLREIAAAPVSAFKHWTATARHDGVTTPVNTPGAPAPAETTGSPSSTQFGKSQNYYGFEAQPVERVVYAYTVPSGNALLLTKAVHAIREGANAQQPVWLNKNLLAFWRADGVRVTEAAPLSQIINGDCLIVFPSNTRAELAFLYTGNAPARGSIELQIRLSGFLAESFVAERLKTLQTEF